MTRITSNNKARYNGKTSKGWKKLQSLENLEEKYGIDLTDERNVKLLCVMRERLKFKKEKLYGGYEDDFYTYVVIEPPITEFTDELWKACYDFIQKEK